MKSTLLGAAMLVMLAACSRTASVTNEVVVTTDAPTSKPASAPLSASASASLSGSPSVAAPKPSSSAPLPFALPFLDDDYVDARKVALIKHRLLFVDAWAPWCHSCVSMREITFRDPSLASLSDRFVFDAVDTEKDENAAFVAAHPNHFWPTLWILDPKTDKALLRWEGTATASELKSLLDEVVATSGASGGDAASDPTMAALASFAEGTRLLADGKVAEGQAKLRAAAEALPATSMARAHAIEALSASLYAQKTDASATTCVNDGARWTGTMPMGTSRATTIASAFGCLERLHDAKLDGALSKDHDALVAAARATLDAPDAAILPDDRSGVFEALVDDAESRADDANRKTYAARWSIFLAVTAAAAPTPEARAVYDWHRILAYKASDQLDQAVPMLEASEAAMPRDFDPPARLGWVYLQLKRYPEGIVEIDRALALGYGPRKLSIYKAKVDLQIASGDVAGAKKTLQEGIDFGNKLPASDTAKKRTDDLTAKLKGLK